MRVKVKKSDGDKSLMANFVKEVIGHELIELAQMMADGTMDNAYLRSILGSIDPKKIRKIVPVVARGHIAVKLLTKAILKALGKNFSASMVDLFEDMVEKYFMRLAELLEHGTATDAEIRVASKDAATFAAIGNLTRRVASSGTLPARDNFNADAINGLGADADKVLGSVLEALAYLEECFQAGDPDARILADEIELNTTEKLRLFAMAWNKAGQNASVERIKSLLMGSGLAMTERDASAGVTAHYLRKAERLTEKVVDKLEWLGTKGIDFGQGTLIPLLKAEAQVVGAMLTIFAVTWSFTTLASILLAYLGYPEVAVLMRIAGFTMTMVFYTVALEIIKGTLNIGKAMADGVADAAKSVAVLLPWVKLDGNRRVSARDKTVEANLSTIDNLLQFLRWRFEMPMFTALLLNWILNIWFGHHVVLVSYVFIGILMTGIVTAIALNFEKAEQAVKAYYRATRIVLLVAMVPTLLMAVTSVILGWETQDTGKMLVANAVQLFLAFVVQDAVTVVAILSTILLFVGAVMATKDRKMLKATGMILATGIIVLGADCINKDEPEREVPELKISGKIAGYNLKDVSLLTVVKDSKAKVAKAKKTSNDDDDDVDDGTKARRQKREEYRKAHPGAY